MPKGRDAFSDQSFAVQITLDGSARGAAIVDQVLIGGRPAGLYGLEDKSHLVAWLAFCDGIRADVAGQTLRDAMVRVADLIDWTEEMPGQTLAGDLRAVSKVELRRGVTPAKADDEEAKMDEGEAEQGEGEADAVRTPAVWHRLAIKHAVDVGGMARVYTKQPRSAGTDEEIQLLQNAIAAYLHYRNTLPLTAVEMPHPLGPPTEAARTVREWEAAFLTAPDTTLSTTDRGPLIKALWGLLDTKAMRHLTANPALLLNTARPSADLESLPAYVVADHVLTMEQSYPACCAKVTFRDTVRDKFQRLDDEVTRLVEDRSPAPASRGGRRRRPAAAPVTASGASHTVGGDGTVQTAGDGGDEFERFAVQFDLDDRGVIERMYVGARPKSRAGRHSTAWVALCDYVRAVLIGSPIAGVAAALDDQRQRINRIGACLRFTNLLPDRPGGTDDLAGVQRKASRFLADLNEMPGAITDTGGTSGGGAENTLRKAIRGGSGTRSHLLGMLDPKCLSFNFGASSQAATELALRVALHLHFVGTAYRDLADEANLISEEGLAELLFPVNVHHDVACDIGGRVMASLRTRTPFDRALYLQAYDRFSSKRQQARAGKGRSAKDQDDEAGEFRVSQASDGGSDDSEDSVDSDY